MKPHYDEDDFNYLNEYDEVDVTKYLEKMSAHKFITTPDKVTISIKGYDLMFVFDMLLRVSKAMVLNLSGDNKLSSTERSEAIYIAEHAEEVYNAMVEQLKVSKANEEMVN